jgi:CHAT domain-containing protein
MAAVEMEKVKGYFPGTAKVFQSAQATPAAYLASTPEKFQYIHFVTHGTASRTDPLESAVILSQGGSGAGTGEDSYRLYARDILQHPIDAQLVTISACNSSGSKSFAGEGMVGLSWAFLRAGAHNAIGSLWEVSDASTPELMSNLYAGLRQGQAPATALRSAKLSLIHSGGHFSRPFYWAPFQLYAGR